MLVHWIEIENEKNSLILWIIKSKIDNEKFQIMERQKKWNGKFEGVFNLRIIQHARSLYHSIKCILILIG